MISHVSAAAKYFIKITADFPEAFSVSYARQAAVNRAEKSRYKKMPIFSGRCRYFPAGFLSPQSRILLNSGKQTIPR